MERKGKRKGACGLLFTAGVCLMLSACGRAGSGKAVTEAQRETETAPKMMISAPENASADAQAADETESRSLMDRPFAYQVDLTHDGTPELLIVDEWARDDSAEIGVSLVKGDQAIWEDSIGLADGVSRRAYFLCSAGNEDYLVSYRAYLESSGYRYIAEVFYLSEEGDKVYVDNDVLSLRTDTYEDYPLDGRTIARFSNWLNWYLDRSTMLCRNDQGQYSFSTSSAQLKYTEEFSEVFGEELDYSLCDSIEEKTELLNRYLYQQWFGDTDPDGTKRMASAEFYRTAERIIEAAQDSVWMGEELSDGTKGWFEDYNGKKLQIILSKKAYTTPLSCGEVVYYRADDNETPEEAAGYMWERMVAEMTIPSDRRTFTVTNYRITDQKLNTLRSGMDQCWHSYCWENRNREVSVETYLWDWLGYADVVYGFVPVHENMWYFCPRGYFSFEGECGDGKTMDDLGADPKTVIGEKIPFMVEKAPKQVQFVLMKQGSVYRLQRAESMREVYPELPLIREEEEE